MPSKISSRKLRSRWGQVLPRDLPGTRSITDGEDPHRSRRIRTVGTTHRNGLGSAILRPRTPRVEENSMRPRHAKGRLVWVLSHLDEKSPPCRPYVTLQAIRHHVDRTSPCRPRSPWRPYVVMQAMCHHYGIASS